MSGLAASRWALPTLEEFFSTNVTRLDPSTLSEDNSCCHICQEEFPTESTSPFPFGTENNAMANLSLLDILPHAQMKNTGIDEPILLPCGHIYGSNCLQEWFASSGANSCPLCVTSLFTRSTYSAEYEQGSRYHTIRNMPLRQLLTRKWKLTDMVRLDEDTTELTSRIPRYMWKVAVRTLYAGEELPSPGQTFETFDTDAENLFSFFDRHIFLLDDVDTPDERRIENEQFAKLLLGKEIGAHYTQVCESLWRVRGKSMSVQTLYDKLMQDIDGEKECRVIRLAVRAVLDMQQQLSDFAAECDQEEVEEWQA
jgi:hypothetical protein